MSGAHRNLEGKLPITLGTIPLTSTTVPNTVPYSDMPQKAPTPIQDPNLAPTQPVSPASPAGNDATGAVGGWNIYPSMRK